MKHINTTATKINKIKSDAKKIKKEKDIPLAQALELAAQQHGYENFYHATHCASNTQKKKSKSSANSFFLRVFDDEKGYRIEVTDHDSLVRVTDELDEVLDEVHQGYGDMSEIGIVDLLYLGEKCRRLTEKEPCFLDGYSHWMGVLVVIEEYEKAISVGEPILNQVMALIDTAPKKYILNYYDLPNRPFFRLAHHLVLAYYGANQPRKAKALARKMLKLSPSDNIGFRFLLTPPSEED